MRSSSIFVLFIEVEIGHGRDHHLVVSAANLFGTDVVARGDDDIDHLESISNHLYLDDDDDIVGMSMPINNGEYTISSSSASSIAVEVEVEAEVEADGGGSEYDVSGVDDAVDDTR